MLFNQTKYFKYRYQIKRGKGMLFNLGSSSIWIHQVNKSVKNRNGDNETPTIHMPKRKQCFVRHWKKSKNYFLKQLSGTS